MYVHFMWVSGPNPMYVSGPVDMSHWTPATEISPSSSNRPVLHHIDREHLVVKVSLAHYCANYSNFTYRQAELHVLGNFWKLGKVFQNLGTFCFWANFYKFWAKMKIFWANYKKYSFLYCTACLHLKRTSERRVHCKNSSKKSTCDFFNWISFAICTSHLTF